MYAITEENEATNGSKKIAPFKKMAPEELLVTSRPATNAGQLSLTVRTLQHTGHPHPVLSSSTSEVTQRKKKFDRILLQNESETRLLRFYGFVYRKTARPCQ